MTGRNEFSLHYISPPPSYFQLLYWEEFCEHTGLLNQNKHVYKDHRQKKHKTLVVDQIFVLSTDT